MSNTLVPGRTDIDKLKAKIRGRLLAFSVQSQTEMASAIITAAREDLSNLTAGMAVSALCNDEIRTDAEFTATSSYCEAGFDVAIELVALTLADSSDDGGEAVKAVLDRGYARITDIVREVLCQPGRAGRPPTRRGGDFEETIDGRAAQIKHQDAL